MLSKKLPLGFVAFIAVSTAFVFDLPAPFFTLQVSAQSGDARKFEVERLFNTCREYFQNNQFQAALQFCQQAATNAERIGDRPIQAKSLGMLGLTYSNMKNVNKAVDYYQRALAIAQEIKDLQLETVLLQGLFLAKVENHPRKPEADRLFDLGMQQFQTNQFEAASQSWEQALNIYREIKSPMDEINTLINLGAVNNTLANYKKAIYFLEKSLKVAREIKYRKGEGETLRNLGNAYLDGGEYLKAIPLIEQSLAFAREIKDRQGEGQSLGNLGLAYANKGDYQKAMDYQEKSLVIARENKNDINEIQVIGNIANIHLSLGNYPKAIELQMQGLKKAEEVNDILSQGRIRGNLGNVYFYLGNYQEAVKYNEQSLKIAREKGNRKGEAQSLGNLGFAYLYLGDDKKAIDYQKQSLEVAKQIPDFQTEANALSGLGTIYTKLGDYSQAINYHNQHWKLAKKITDSKGEIIALGNIGLVYSYQGDYQKAIDYAQQSLKITNKINDPQSKTSLLNNLGYSFYKQGKLKLAETSLNEAINVLSKDLRRNQLPDRDKISLFDTQRNTYQLLQQVLIAGEKYELALEIAESGRARALAELLIAKSSQSQQKPLVIPNIDKIKQIAKSQNATLVQYSIIYDDFKITNKIQSKESELYIWVIKPTGEIKFQMVDLKFLWQKQNDSLENIIVGALKSLGSNINTRSSSSNNHIDFKVGDLVKPNGAFDRDPPWKVVAVDRQNQTVKIQLTPRKEGEQANEQDRKFTEVTKVSYTNAANTKLQQLYQILVEPIADSLPKNQRDRVIFIPQGSLFFVPFPALQDANSNRNYLIEKHTIQTSPSIQVLDLTRQQRQKLPKSPQNIMKEVLVVGNPTMPVVPLEPGKPPTQLQSLPHAEEEAKQVAQMFNTNAIVGNKATKSALLPLFPKARIIHLATHGLLDDFTGGSIPGAIALAPEPLNKSKDEGINGLLKSSEIFDLQLNNTELVVLSACDTGRGKITGDGVIGLSRSFIRAGVPSVVVSLWSVDDDATKFLMGEFYQKLKNNSDKASALRDAMLATKGKNPDPKYWAAFTLIGETN